MPTAATGRALKAVQFGVLNSYVRKTEQSERPIFIAHPVLLYYTRYT